MNLSGTWIGQYRYPDGAQDAQSGNPMPPVSFTTHISDAGGAFEGQVEEENAPPSRLRGTREGNSITFSKRYSGTDGGRFLHRVLYQGGVNEDATRIDGHWVILEDNQFSGDFFMMREKPPTTEKEAEKEAENV